MRSFPSWSTVGLVPLLRLAHTGMRNPKNQSRSAQEEQLMPTVHHRYLTVDGHRLFYREAGDPNAPALVLLHGFPTSSYMFRELVPALADRYHVIAPDHLGFGLSDAPSVEQFDYTFDALTALTQGLLRALKVGRYAIYVQDYGAPIGWRLALNDPNAITAVISQSGNAYDAGFVESFWKVVTAYQAEQTAETEGAVRQFLTLDATRWQYVTGVPDETLVNPESWYHDYALISRPGNDEVQLKLLRDYASNSPQYPRVHDYFRAFAEDLPDAEIHLVDGGHFLLESALDEVTGLIHSFLAKVLPAA
jgi:pimeloyl-ACP methyl ester carboxylesterase